MKKGVFVLLMLVLFISGGMFAQEKSANSVANWISGEVSVLGAGARYERMLSPQWSVGVNGYWNSLFFFFQEIEAGASARFYPWGGMFFVGLGTGFHFHMALTDDDWVNIIGVSISPEVGFKIDVGQVGGFFIQPGVKVPITLGEKQAIFDDNKFGVGVGVVAYIGLGYAF